MADPQQILKSLYKLMTQPGTIYSHSNIKQDRVCLWHIVKIPPLCFPQLKKALMGSGNCSWVCQENLNQLSTSSLLHQVYKKNKKYKNKK